jgi:hypothetical protein
MPPSGKLYVGVWKIRFREKWNMVKIDDSHAMSHHKIEPVDASVDQRINVNQIQDGGDSGHLG